MIKKGEVFIKTVFASVIAVGLFCAAFVLANNVALSAAVNRSDSIYIAAVSVNIPPEIIPPEGFVKPSLTVYEASTAPDTVNTNAMSYIYAAELGAQYIWEVFGVCIDGKVVEMFSTFFPFGTESYWFGRVAESEALINSNEVIFGFTLDAVSGKRIGIYQSVSALLGENDPSLTQEELHKIDEFPNLYVEAEEIAQYEQIAKEYAGRHFNSSNIAAIEFDRASPLRLGREPDGELIVTEYEMFFMASDDSCCVVEIAILMSTKELRRINTLQDDECFTKSGHLSSPH